MTAATLEQTGAYLTMALAAFASGTLLPLASEAVLVAQLKAGYGSTIGLLLAATAGNTIGALFNWWIGLNIRRFEHRRWFPFRPQDLALAGERFNRWSAWTLLLSWVPVIGDPLTCAAGLMRTPLLVFLPLVAIGKGARYAAVAGLFQL